MGGIIDFNTDCPWQLYLFSFMHLLGGVAMYLMDVSRVMTGQGTPSTGSEEMMQRLAALSMLYVGVLFTAMTYHNKRSAANITTLSNVALSCATAFLASCVFTGNASLGGLEKSWMHIGDVLTMSIIVGVLFSRVTQTGTTFLIEDCWLMFFVTYLKLMYHSIPYTTGAEWAEKKALGEGLGMNCKTLLLLFLPLTILKFIAYTDFIDPTKLLAEGLEMTRLAHWMWNIVVILIFECAMALIYTILFDDAHGHEVVIMSMAAMTLLAGCSIYSVQGYLSSWMGINGNGMWIKITIMVGVCILAVVGGRMGGHREGYTKV